MTFLDNIKFMPKLMGSFLLVVILLGIVAFVGYSSIGTVNKGIDEVYTGAMKPSIAIDDAQLAMYTLRGDVYKFLLLPDQRAATEVAMQKDIADFNAAFSTFRNKGGLTPEEQAEITNVDKEWADYQAAISDIVTKAKANDTAGAYAGLAAGSPAVTSRAALDSSVTALTNIQSATGESTKKTSDATYANASLILIVLSVVSVVIALSLGFIIAKSIAGPANRTVEVLKKMGAGDLKERLKFVRKDEIGIMSQNIDIMADQLSSTISSTLKQTEELAALAQEANASVEEVAGGAAQVAKNSSAVSTAAENSQNNIAQVLKAMEDLSVTVAEVASKAEQVSKLAEDTNNLSKEGAKLAHVAEDGMMGITKSSNEVDSIIIDIKQQMDEIGKIVGLISNLANQTNLLSLNAAIEAARAGEAGLGFAVVATEVKALAQESQTSAESISQMINTLQKKTEMAATAMSRATTQVKEGSGALAETITSFNNIVKSVDGMSRGVVAVASASEQQAAAVEEITSSIHEVKSIVEGTSRDAMDSAAAAEQASAAIDQVGKVVDNLNRIVEKVSTDMSYFKV
jgi:methyl-accepting chemotaxis protein